jgi:DNA-binding response OmpR family regulator
MTGPRRIVVVDDEPAVVRMLQAALALPDYEVHAFSEAKEALFRLHDIGPELILADMRMPDMDGAAFLKVVKRSVELKDVPFVFLSGISSNDEIVGLYELGADDFVNKPFHLGRLVAKVRALLRMNDRRRDALTGPVGPDGPLPLLKFCEDSRLSGRLVVQSRFERRFVEFVGGDIVRAGGEPETEEDALDALLAMRAGAYRIEQQRLDRAVLVVGTAPAPEPPKGDGAEAAPAPISLPAGRLSQVDVRGRSLQVQTEAENKPNFTVTTVVASGGKVVRKIENAWQHALHRRDDLDLARSQIDRQHERVVATLNDLAAPKPEAAGADGGLMAWAATFLAEQVRDHAGAVMTAALLRRTHRELLPRHPALRSWRVSEDGRVSFAGGSADLALEAVAAWVAAFLGEGGQLVPKLAGLKVRAATRMMEAELEKAGFYAALERAGYQG